MEGEIEDTAFFFLLARAMQATHLRAHDLFGLPKWLRGFWLRSLWLGNLDFSSNSIWMKRLKQKHVGM